VHTGTMDDVQREMSPHKVRMLHASCHLTHTAGQAAAGLLYATVSAPASPRAETSTYSPRGVKRKQAEEAAVWEAVRRHRVDGPGDRAL
jgi:hypothetical protein